MRINAKRRAAGKEDVAAEVYLCRRKDGILGRGAEGIKDRHRDKRGFEK